MLKEQQLAMEERFQSLRQQAIGKTVSYYEVLGPLDNWIIDAEGYRLVLYAPANRWLLFDELHDSFTDIDAVIGEVVFEVRDDGLWMVNKETGEETLLVKTIPPSTNPSPTEHKQVDFPASDLVPAAQAQTEILPTWLVTIASGPQAGREIEAAAEGIGLVLGRDHTADITLPDPKISRRHAGLLVENKLFFLADLNSSNGTWLNGHEITTQTQIFAGDRVTLGDTILVISKR